MARIFCLFLAAALWALSGLAQAFIWPDVEQGACLLVIGPEQGGVKPAMLIDAGTGRSVAPEEPPHLTLRRLLEEDPRIAIRYVLLTHFHSDHSSWLATIKEAGLLAPDYEEHTRLTVEPGQVFDLGGLTVKVVVASGYAWDGERRIQVTTATDENPLSVGLLISYGGFQLWVGGDLTSPVEVKIAPYVGDVDVYVMHHHGSYTSSSLPFLRVLRPEVVIAQLGDMNPYGHPHPSALRNVLSTPDTDGDPRNGTPLILLQNAGSYAGGLSQVYVADPDGPGGRPGWIMLTSDGTSYTLRFGDTTLTLPVDERNPRY
ncbi:MAG: MBL fold metallo-hydrolase [Thermofilaceae archaeon]